MANSPLLTMPVLKMQEGITLCDSDYCNYPLCEDFVKEGIYQGLGFLIAGVTPSFRSDLPPTNFYMELRPVIPGNIFACGRYLIQKGSMPFFVNSNWSSNLYWSARNTPACTGQDVLYQCSFTAGNNKSPDKIYLPEIYILGNIKPQETATLNLKRAFELYQRDPNRYKLLYDTSIYMPKAIRQMAPDKLNALSLVLPDLRSTSANFVIKEYTNRLSSDEITRLDILIKAFVSLFFEGSSVCIQGPNSFSYTIINYTRIQGGEGRRIVRELLPLCAKARIHFLGLMSSKRVDNYSPLYLSLVPPTTETKDFFIEDRGYNDFTKNVILVKATPSAGILCPPLLYEAYKHFNGDDLNLEFNP